MTISFAEKQSAKTLIKETRFKVRTRDEDFRPFDRNRIETAIAKALAASEKLDSVSPPLRETAVELTESVCQGLLTNRNEDQVIWLEDIQDQVELVMMREGRYEAARLFVQYRERHRQDRERLIDTIVDKPEKKNIDPLLLENDDRFVLFPIEHVQKPTFLSTVFFIMNPQKKPNVI